jgi:hypothetical protein
MQRRTAGRPLLAMLRVCFTAAPPAKRNEPGCSLCAGASIFSAFFMFFLGILIKSNYQ